jgi:predicted transcriptional regulator
MKEIQNELFETTEVGRELLRNAKDTETAIKKLQEASKDGLTREKLLDLLLSAENDLQLSTIASLARSGLDYQFFQLLTEKIDSASNDNKNRLTKTRERLLDITDEIDKRLQEEMKKASDNLNKVLDAENTEEMLLKNPEIIDEFFYQQLEAALKHARKAGDLERITKLEKIMGLIEKAMAPSEELQLLQELLGIENEKELIEKIDENIERITPEFMSILNIMITQTENQQDQPELKEHQ